MSKSNKVDVQTVDAFMRSTCCPSGSGDTPVIVPGEGFPATTTQVFRFSTTFGRYTPPGASDNGQWINALIWQPMWGLQAFKRFLGIPMGYVCDMNNSNLPPVQFNPPYFLDYQTPTDANARLMLQTMTFDKNTCYAPVSEIAGANNQIKFYPPPAAQYSQGRILNGLAVIVDNTISSTNVSLQGQVSTGAPADLRDNLELTPAALCTQSISSKDGKMQESLWKGIVMNVGPDIANSMLPVDMSYQKSDFDSGVGADIVDPKHQGATWDASSAFMLPSNPCALPLITFDLDGSINAASGVHVDGPLVSYEDQPWNRYLYQSQAGTVSWFASWCASMNISYVDGDWKTPGTAQYFDSPELAFAGANPLGAIGFPTMVPTGPTSWAAPDCNVPPATGHYGSYIPCKPGLVNNVTIDALPPFAVASWRVNWRCRQIASYSKLNAVSNTEFLNWLTKNVLKSLGTTLVVTDTYVAVSDTSDAASKGVRFHTEVSKYQQYCTNPSIVANPDSSVVPVVVSSTYDNGGCGILPAVSDRISTASTAAKQVVDTDLDTNCTTLDHQTINVPGFRYIGTNFTLENNTLMVEISKDAANACSVLITTTGVIESANIVVDELYRPGAVGPARVVVLDKLDVNATVSVNGFIGCEMLPSASQTQYISITKPQCLMPNLTQVLNQLYNADGTRFCRITSGSEWMSFRRKILGLDGRPGWNVSSAMIDSFCRGDATDVVESLSGGVGLLMVEDEAINEPDNHKEYLAELQSLAANPTVGKSAGKRSRSRGLSSILGDIAGSVARGGVRFFGGGERAQNIAGGLATIGTNFLSGESAGQIGDNARMIGGSARMIGYPSDNGESAARRRRY
jgi:hypothetical protein